MVPFPNPFMPVDIETDGEPLSYHRYYQQGMNDAHFAAQLQRQENGHRQRYRGRMPYIPFQRPSHPSSSQTSEGEQPEVIPLPSAPRSVDRPPFFNDEEDEDDMASYANFNPLMQFMNHPNGPIPGAAFHQLFGIFPGRHYRRGGGNLQDTEDDFGPEDYEVMRISINNR